MAEQQSRFAADLKEDQRLHAVAFEKQETDFAAHLTTLTTEHRQEIAEKENRFAADLKEV